jgi:hypothetical protein
MIVVRPTNRSAGVRIALSMAMMLGIARIGVAQQTGMLTGVVHDAQGGVLPGVAVTVQGPALIGGAQATVTGEGGSYQFSLPPGTFEVHYELSGFTPLTRAGIIVEVARTARIDVELGVGRVEQSVTVSGQSPVVDVSTTVSQTNITKDLYEAIPTSRNPWVMAGLVPGVVTGRLDVGGSEGAQQYNIEAFGSANSQKSFSIDGLKVNWGGGDGGATMIYYGFEMYEEYNMQTASGTAQSDVAGVYMNMVTKSGGNRFTSDHNVYFQNRQLQGSNVDDTLRARLGLKAGQQSAAAGAPIDVAYDWSSTLGGPIAHDKAWFFGAIRWWRLNQFQVGALNPDGSQAIDDNRIRNFVGKATVQIAPKIKTSFLFNRNLNDRFHRRNPPYLFVADKATILQEQPAQNYIAQWNQVVGTKMVVEAQFGRMWGVNPSQYQKAVGPNDIAIRDVVRFTLANAATDSSLNPNDRYQANVTASYFVDRSGSGSHDLKAGFQMSREGMQYNRIRNGDYFLELNNGVPFQAQLSNTPIESDHRLQTWGAFVQDRWVIGRATINAGARTDGVKAWLPAQTSPAGNFVGTRSFPEIGVFSFPFNIAPRLGVAYDLFGTGRTAVKAYYGRFYTQFGSQIAEAANPNAIVNQAVSWTDLNGNLALDPGELGTFTGFPRGLFPTVDAGSTRPYSDEVNAGIDQQLARNLALSVSYHRTQHRNGLGILDRARTADAYVPIQRNYVDPITGASQAITIYNLLPAFVGARDRYISNVAFLQSNYDGLQIDLQKRLSNRWQMLGGVSFGRHRGFDHSGAYTGVDFSDPNTSINRNDGSVFTDLPWTVTVSGSYQFPYAMTASAKYTGRAGDPLNRTTVFSGLTASQASETIRLAQRGTDRTDDVTKLVDLRVSKKIAVRAAALELTVDLFNVMNANSVLLENEQIGPTWGTPTRILAPRVVRLGLSARF